MTGKTLDKLKQLLKSNVRSPASSELNPADVAVYEAVRRLILYLLDHAVITPNGKIPGMYDDIEEYDSFDSLPQPGESGKMYSVDGELYVWDGTEYKEAAGKDVVETLSTHVSNGDIHVGIQSVPVKTINDTWTCVPQTTQFGTPFSVKWTVDATEGEGWALFTNDTKQGKVFTNADADTLTWSPSTASSSYDVTAVRVPSQQGYKINSGSSEKFQPAGDYATAKQNFEVKTKADGALQRSGGTITGDITVQESFTVGSRKANTRLGDNSVAEGFNTTASGDYSHAEGKNTIAQNTAEHAQGVNNASHTGNTPAENTLYSIGVGTPNARQNAVEVMQDGKVFVKGLGNYEGTNPTASGVLDLATAIYAIIQQLAPEFDPVRSYNYSDTVSKGGIIYQCINANGHYGAWKDNNWKAKPISELYLSVLGGEIVSDIVIREGGIKLYGNGNNYWAIYKDALGIYLYGGTDQYFLVPNDGTRTGGGTFALTAGSGHANNLAALDASGNPVDSGIAVNVLGNGRAVVVSAPDGYEETAGLRVRKPGLADLAGKFNTTLYVYSGVQVYRGGVLTQYAYDNSANGIARIQDLRYTFVGGGDAPVDRSVRHIAVTAATQTLPVMPAAVSGKVRDFIVDVTNVSQATSVIDFIGLGDTWDAVVKSGESLSSMTTLAAGEMARFYFMETAFPGNRPVFLVVKDVIEVPSSAQADYSLNTDGTVSTEGEPNSDGTLSIEAVPNDDGTVSVEAS